MKLQIRPSVLFAMILMSSATGIGASALLARLLSPFLLVSLVGSVLALVSFYGYRFILLSSVEVDQCNGSLTVAFLSGLLAACLSLLFLTTLPLNIDRSFSVWMLRQVEIQDSSTLPMHEDALQEGLSEFFAPNSGELNRRLGEQLSLGTIQREGDGFHLTPRGKAITKFNTFISWAFDLNPRYARTG